MIVRFIALVGSIFDKYNALDVYVFGSALTRTDPADLDLLVVYEDASDLSEFMSELYARGGPLPLDVTAMTPSELAGSNFLARSRAISAREFGRTRICASDPERDRTP